MKVYFEKVVVPCVMDDVIAWHAAHGWVWDIVEVSSGRRVGVYYCTLLCGDGAIVHFSTVPGMCIPWVTTLSAMRKGIRMVSGSVNVVFATIAEEEFGLMRCAYRLGFRETGVNYLRDGKKIVLLQYFGREKRYINAETGNH